MLNFEGTSRKGVSPRRANQIQTSRASERRSSA
jgi:hypothetical protein